MTHERTPMSGTARLAQDDTQLHVSVVSNLDDLAAFTPQWEQLVATSPHVTGYSTPVATLTWFRWFLSATNGVYALAVWRGNELVGLAPFSVTRLPFPLTGFRLLSTPGAEHGYFGEPLLGPEPEPVAELIAEHVAGLVHNGTTAVRFRRLASNGPMARALATQPAMICNHTHRHTRSLIRFDLVTDHDEYLAKLARKHQIPRRKRRLTERFDHVEYVPHDQQPDAALDTMRDMSLRRFGKGEGPEIFSSPSYEAFMRRLAREMIKAGQARVSSLVADGHRIVVSLDLCVNNHALLYTTAYEPDLAPFSLGKIELFEALRHVHESGVREVDLGSAKYSYKQEWANTTGYYDSLTLVSRGRLGKFSEFLSRYALSYRARHLYGFIPSSKA